MRVSLANGTTVCRTGLGVALALAEVAGEKKKGQEISRASSHPFPARMPLSLAKHLIGRMTTPDAVVLDPMAGSGTTLVAAKQLGRNALGFDIDPLSYLVAATATRTHRQSEFDGLAQRILQRARKRIGPGKRSLPELRGQLPAEDQDFLKYWFPPQSQKQLFAISESISREPNGPAKDVAWIVFSSLIIAKSVGASYAMDISRSRPHKRGDKEIRLPFDSWERKFRIAVKRLPFVNDCRAMTSVRVRRGDARHLPVKGECADFVLTSPPYLNAVDYMRTHKFSLLWMGHRLADLREIRGTMIGSERGLFGPDGIPEALEHRLGQRIEDKARRSRVRKYLADMARSVREIARVLRPGGAAILVVGPTILNATRTDSADVLNQLGQAHGLDLISHVDRVISPRRRSLPAPADAAATNALGSRMRREIIVALRKPPAP